MKLTLKTSLLLASLTQLAWGLIPAKDLKPNVFVLTDISNEPDDAESLVRLLLYTNELSLKGIVATTSFWLNYTIHDEDIYPVIDAYEKVHPNLLKHSETYPTADYLRSIVATGKPAYGLNALTDSEPISQGASNLIKAIDESENEPFYILVWGGAAVIAEALNEVKSTRTEEEVSKFTSNVTVYSISDQDNAGPWIRHNFPQLKYIASLHAFNHYGHSAWVGISGEIYNHFDEGGPDSTTITKDWVRENITPVGPLGAAYPEFLFLMEGDTPSTLFVLPNGLNAPEHPEFGGWGGRYGLSDQTGAFRHYGDTQDHVLGVDGKIHVSNKATIWRWRNDFQNDFAARLQWTVKSFEDAVHQPIAVYNKSESVLPVDIVTDAGSTVKLDLTDSYDLNGNALKYEWFHYRELTATQGNLVEIPEIEITKLNEEGSVIEFEAPSFKTACYNLFGRPSDSCKIYHIIAKVSNDAGPLSVSTYKRFLIKTRPGPNDKFEEEVKYEQNFDHVTHDEL